MSSELSNSLSSFNPFADGHAACAPVTAVSQLHLNIRYIPAPRPRRCATLAGRTSPHTWSTIFVVLFRQPVSTTMPIALWTLVFVLSLWVLTMPRGSRSMLACIVSWFYTTVSTDVLHHFLAGRHCVTAFDVRTAIRTIFLSKQQLNPARRPRAPRISRPVHGQHAWLSTPTAAILRSSPTRDVGDLIFDHLQSPMWWLHRGRIKIQILSRQGKLCFEYVYPCLVMIL